MLRDGWEMNIPERSYILVGHGEHIDNKIQGTYFRLESRSLDLYFGRCLNCRLVEKAGFDLIFLGDFYDPDNPDLNNDAVIEKIMQNDSFEGVMKNTYTIFGKWIIICDYGNKIEIMGDPQCTKSVKYHKKVLVVSDLASLVAHIVDGVSAFDFLVGDPHRHYAENIFCRNQWWPGEVTLYPEVYSLLPNHMFAADMTGVCGVSRFMDSHGPRDDGKDWVDYCYNRSKQLVTGFLLSISSRCEIAVPVTGGRDSRVLYAACRSHGIDAHYFYSIHGKKSLDDQECIVVKKLIEKCGGDFAFCVSGGKLGSKSLIETYFKDINETSFSGYDYLSQIGGAESCKIVMGLIPEVISCYYDNRMYGVSALGLMDLARCAGSKLAFEQYSKWLNLLKNVNLPDGYSILDLFYWEHRSGRWAAQTVNVCDLFEDLVWGFNCREFYDVWMKSHKNVRKYPHRENLVELARVFGEEYVSVGYYDNPLSRCEYLLTDLGIRKPVRQTEYWLYRLKTRAASLLGGIGIEGSCDR
jgi:hypothetical protein